MVRFISIGLALILSHFISNAQIDSYYVVIGSFAIESNANRLVQRANELNIPATYAFHPDHKLFYVFVRDTKNKGAAYETLLSMQEEGFSDAWVYKGWLNTSIVFKDGSDTNTATVDSTRYRENKLADADASPRSVDDEAREVPDEIQRSSGKRFIFNVVNAATGKPVKGQVHLLESQRSLQYRAVNANEALNVAAPKNKNGRWYIACYVVGYKPTGSSFLYAPPHKTPGVAVSGEGEVVIPLELERVGKGDYIEMDNVKFFPNSSLFTPESERELMELVAMMDENRDYKIKVHGHTNGQPQGEIIARGNGVNFFSIEQETVRAAASAKQLSTWRAEAVKEFLVSKGIDPSRISTKGEGDKQPIFDPKRRDASGNDRVEVEITRS